MKQNEKEQSSSMAQGALKTVVFTGALIGIVDIVSVLLAVLGDKAGGQRMLLWNIPVVLAVLVISVLIVARRDRRKAEEKAERLRVIVEAAEQLARGDTDMQLENRAGDTYGTLTAALERIAATSHAQAVAVAQLARGDLQELLADGPVRQPFSEGLRQAACTIQALQSEIAAMSQKQQQCELSAFVVENHFEGAFAAIARDVNAMIQKHVEAREQSLSCVAELAESSFDMSVFDESVNSNLVGDSITQLKHTLWLFANDMQKMSEQQNAGDVDALMPVDAFQGVYADLAKGVNNMVQSQIAVTKKAMACVEQFAEGNFETGLEQFPGKKVFISDTIEKLRANINAFITAMNNMSADQDAGDLDAFIPVEQFKGAYASMADGVNRMVKSHISVKKKAMACVQQFAQGNFEAELEQFPGKKAFINETIEGLRSDLKNVNTEIGKLIIASENGQLDERGNAEQFSGDWKYLIEGLNRLLDVVIEPMQEAAEVLSEMQNGNLAVEMTGDYKGDHAKIKHALNATITSIQALLTSIQSSAQEVSAGSGQVSESAQMLSQGATEQASALQELTASVAEIAAQTKQNAADAAQASAFAASAQTEAVNGNEKMEQMLNAMQEIGKSSSNISKIIKVIDDIAFQTNILALNAAVEAARAGQYGKGFAVVAEEVRNLAARSTKAAKQTTELIEGSVSKVKTGEIIANETAETLGKISESVEKTNDLVGNISSSSDQQATAISQIDQGLEQISGVVQNNSATAEESAASSEELSGQADTLLQMVAAFQLQRQSV
ncbi:MAG: methyl-accepting chemotaxis protein [Ethanoligenens sp.]